MNKEEKVLQLLEKWGVARAGMTQAWHSRLSTLADKAKAELAAELANIKHQMASEQLIESMRNLKRCQRELLAEVNNDVA